MEDILHSEEDYILALGKSSSWKQVSKISSTKLQDASHCMKSMTRNRQSSRGQRFRAPLSLHTFLLLLHQLFCEGFIVPYVTHRDVLLPSHSDSSLINHSTLSSHRFISTSGYGLKAFKRLKRDLKTLAIQ